MSDRTEQRVYTSQLSLELRERANARNFEWTTLVAGRGKVSAVRVTPDGTKIVVGCADGSASVYAVDPLKDDLGATLLGVVYPGQDCSPYT